MRMVDRLPMVAASVRGGIGAGLSVGLLACMPYGSYHSTGVKGSQPRECWSEPVALTGTQRNPIASLGNPMCASAEAES